MGRKRNRKKRATKGKDNPTNLANDERVQENGKHLSLNEEAKRRGYDMKTSDNTSESEVASNIGSFKCETIPHATSDDENNSPTVNCIRQHEFKSNRFPSEYSQYDDMEESRCSGISAHKFKNKCEKPVIRDELKKKINNRIVCYSSSSTFVGESPTNPKKCLEAALNRWLPVRNKNIRKLRELLVKVTEDEPTYDNLDLAVKYGSQICKGGKIQAAPSSPWEFLCSIGSFACDVAGALSSVSHMINTDNIQSEFQKIMDEDADVTKEMYQVRSKYVAEYRYTEEVIRNFEGTTLGETLEKVSEAVGVTEFFGKMEKAKDNNEDTMMAAITALDSVVTRNCNRDVGREVGDAVHELIDTNPACVGLAAGIAKSLYGLADLQVKSKTSNTSHALVSVGTRALDLALVRQDASDIAELTQKIEDGSQTTIGKRIQKALDMFEKEKNEMLELLRNL